MFSLAEIAAHIDAQVVGDGDLKISGIGSLQHASNGQLSHLSHSGYRQYLSETNASAVILTTADQAACPVPALVVANPSLAYAKASQLFSTRQRTELGVHESSVVHETATIGKGVRIGALCTIGPGTHVGDRVEVSAGSHIGANCVIGDDTLVLNNVVLYQDVRIGARGVVHANAVIGADGFGFTPDEEGQFVMVAQLGGVSIGNDVVVGASNTIDRGALEDTVIEDGVKLDDQVHVGHNCHIGEHSLLCGCTGLAGSVTVGKHVILGGGVGVAGSGPLEIVDGVQVGAMTFVSRSITEPGIYSGNVLHNKNAAWRRNMIRLNELDELAKRLHRLESKLAKDEQPAHRKDD